MSDHMRVNTCANEAHDTLRLFPLDKLTRTAVAISTRFHWTRASAQDFAYFVLASVQFKCKLDRLNESHPGGDIAEFVCGCSSGRTGQGVWIQKKILLAAVDKHRLFSWMSLRDFRVCLIE